MSSSGEVYGVHILPDRFNADILLPNGLFITIPCKREDTLETVKRQLWKTINSSAIESFDIGNQSSFIFSAITYDGKLEEFYQESRRLCDLRLFDLILKLVEPEGNKDEKKLNSMIDIAIGKKVAELLLDLPREIRNEVTEFRKGSTDYEEALVDQVDQGLLYSSYSNYVDVPFKLRIISASYLNVKNVDALFVRVAIYHGTECLGVKDSSQVEPSNPKWDQWLKFDFHCTDLPRSAKVCLSICVVSKKRQRDTYSLGTVNFSLFNWRGFMRSGKIQFSLWPPLKDSEDLLSPLGVLGSNPSNDSASILLELISFDRHVIFAPIRDIYSFASHAIQLEPTIDSETVQIPSLAQGVSSSLVSGSNCYTHYSSIKVDFRDRTLSNSCADTRAFIERRLSSSSNNRRDSISTTYNDNLTSNRSRRPTTNSDKFSAPSSRASSTASMLVRLDSNGGTKIPTGSRVLTAGGGGGHTTMLNNSPMNTSINSLSQNPTSPIASPVNLPIPESPSAQFASLRSSDGTPFSDTTSQSSSIATSTSVYNQATEEQNIILVNELIATPPFSPLTNGQKSLLWKMRFYCKRIPESLPKLLDAIDWKSRNQLSQLYVLLDEWGQVSLETALRLLDPKYEDRYVRQHAVRWLDNCIDEEMLSCYLLQFVQVLKTEPYLDNELSRFLNNRALLSKSSIGNLFFWYLRSECDEISDYHNTIRFRYLLERYLRNLSEDKLTILVRQVQGFDKLMNLAEALKDKTKEDRLKFMQTQLERVDFAEMLENIPDPVNNRRFLGEILHDECRIMDSAKRPLWIVWSLPIFNDERVNIYTENPKSEEDVISQIARGNKRSYSYSGSNKDHTLKELKMTAKSSIKEDDFDLNIGDHRELANNGTNNSNSNNGQVLPEGSSSSTRFTARTMTSSSDTSSKQTTTNIKSVAEQISKAGSMSSSNGCTNYNGVAVATSAIIFKIGDDLRQDMLTLQIIKIVDALWRSEGLDMCMLAYSCLATGKNVGLIEVVNRAETITSIQKSGGRMATIQIDSTQLHRWIKERNHDNYDEAIRRFTHSCAGYSVLTFVLGIADRNPDNIMVSEDGRIFHIDFGHFLGHFKKKFGINRERVPFVLTDDFLHVIARGSGARKSDSFDSFRNLCDQAYVSLRRHSNLLITLFTMMLRTGIPELRSLEDISYLRTSLQVGVTEQEAREFFHAQFFEAYSGAWATKVDWFFHNIKRM